MTFKIKKDEIIDLEEIKKLVELQYKRNDNIHTRGTLETGRYSRNLSSHLEDRSWRISSLVTQLNLLMNLTLWEHSKVKRYNNLRKQSLRNTKTILI